MAKRRGRAAFSLIEVAMAVGIVGFSLVAILGLMGVGLTTFNGAMTTSVGAQIAQRVVNDMQETDFTLLTGTAGGNTATGTAPFIYLWPTSTGSTTAVRYFDDEANEHFAPFVAGVSRPVYQVQTRINPLTVMPSAAGTSQLATVTVQVLLNPANTTVPSDTNPVSSTYLLWSGSQSVTTTSAIISNNGG
jgi:uncharacterized protein (TIGR02598 family)